MTTNGNGPARNVESHVPSTHLDTCQYRTILHAAPPRSQCPEHGVRVVKLAWAEPHSRFTAFDSAAFLEFTVGSRWMEKSSSLTGGPFKGLCFAPDW
jgi:hypothetical protein